MADGPLRIIRKPELRTITGLSDTTIWRLEKNGDFPARKAIGVAVGWRSDEVDDWLDNLRTVDVGDGERGRGLG